ncbi:hypothetical protein EUTSA_v10002745mg [Eutrema salsugineum]|uniref:Glycine-rich protein n=1 Tax=Eutrema salsugineum TaxID=72664 RepID=V4LCN4_EUTSA|nr:uncharacterized protein LOC18013606 [Eutrema salsugineum]ESQ37503.1 hypothetical protein EUTSA_v10002745mg [Eutrema salsugineum]
MGVKSKLIVIVIMVVIMIMVSSCSAARTTILGEDIQENEKISREMTWQEEDSTEKVDHPRNSVENHHYIPRQDFNNYGAGRDNNGGGG